MSESTGPFEGLTEDELASLQAESEQLSHEDATSWAQRAGVLAEQAKALAASRRAEATAAADVGQTEEEHQADQEAS